MTVYAIGTGRQLGDPGPAHERDGFGLAGIAVELEALEALGLVRGRPGPSGEVRYGLTANGRAAHQRARGPGAPPSAA
jgi:hypothetical protein